MRNVEIKVVSVSIMPVEVPKPVLDKELNLSVLHLMMFRFSRCHLAGRALEDCASACAYFSANRNLRSSLVLLLLLQKPYKLI